MLCHKIQYTYFDDYDHALDCLKQAMLEGSKNAGINIHESVRAQQYTNVKGNEMHSFNMLCYLFGIFRVTENTSP